MAMFGKREGIEGVADGGGKGLEYLVVHPEK
jgi:hypothetical protein